MFVVRVTVTVIVSRTNVAPPPSPPLAVIGRDAALMVLSALLIMVEAPLRLATTVLRHESHRNVCKSVLPLVPLVIPTLR